MDAPVLGFVGLSGETEVRKTENRPPAKLFAPETKTDTIFFPKKISPARNDTGCADALNNSKKA
ncbi:MAG: hypothetical protein D6714_05025 [Bacteroidetes bacterium]|nr:MAG: hypothetical protein D6714_05025 [Bacteroidota bacterium]